MSYNELLKFRDQTVDGVTGWMWVNQDNGAWDGPHREWQETHKDAYLRYITGRDVVVQAGGNCGLYPRLFSQYFKTVYTFEPDPLNFHCLVNNCQQDNIIKINGALGSDNEMVRVNRADMGNVGMHKVSNEGGDCFVPTFAIDQLNLHACNLIQLDVEGYEIRILHGSVETISKFHPVISCENGGGQVTEFLQTFGYVAKEVVGADTIFVFQG